MRARAFTLSILLLGTAGLLAWFYEPGLPMVEQPRANRAVLMNHVIQPAELKTGIPNGFASIGSRTGMLATAGKDPAEGTNKTPNLVEPQKPESGTIPPPAGNPGLAKADGIRVIATLGSPQNAGTPSTVPSSADVVPTNHAATLTNTAAFTPPLPGLRPEAVAPPSPHEGTKLALPTHESSSSVRIISSVTSTNKEIAITFDDGPHPTLTFKVLDELRVRNIKATFFVLGDRVKQYPWIVQQIAAEGHEIGNHTYSHRFLKFMSNEAIEREITETQSLIKQATGFEPTLFRPPYGEFRPDTKEVFQKHNLTVIRWSVDPLDWKVHDEDRIVGSVTNKVRSGSIILCHDIHLSTIHALPHILDALIAAGYQFTTVSQLCGLPTSQSKLATVSAPTNQTQHVNGRPPSTVN